MPVSSSWSDVDREAGRSMQSADVVLAAGQPVAGGENEFLREVKVTTAQYRQLTGAQTGERAEE